MIWPLDPVIEEDQRAAAMWLENRGAQTVSLQIRVLAWTQANGEESYDNQDGIIPSPPSAVIQPGQRQLVRLMKASAIPDAKELAYRILVDELPSAAAAAGQDESNGAAAGNSMGIKLQIRYSVPLFVSGKGHWMKPRADRKREPATAAQPVLSWRTLREGPDNYLVIRNTGNAHARLTAVQWVRGNETQPINPGLLGYVLANTQMRWRLERPPPMGFVPQVRVNASDKPVELATQ
ncbi:fimbrial biogenesis chaperone [Rhodoferax saidenbachensis]|nr:fimbria/pilus periplasmic chaperone [Rhodoferax saidenbachensis]